MKKTFLTGALFGALAAALILHPLRCTPPAREYVYATVHDTVTVDRPVPVAVRETIRIETHTFTSLDGDSVKAVVPFSALTYSGPGYRAYVSGFRPRLDSLVFEHTTTQILPSKKKRWAVGIQAGVAATPKGIQPFVGIGITYKLFDF